MFPWISFLFGPPKKGKKEATKPRESAQNSDVLQLDIPFCGSMNEMKTPAVCNLAVTVFLRAGII